MPSSLLFSLLRPQSSMPSRNARVSPRLSSIRLRPPSEMGIWIGRSPSLTTWPRCALAENGMIGNVVNRGRITLRQARRMILVTWKSNRNARIPTHRLGVNFHSNVGLSNVCIALATPRCPSSNDNTPSVASTRCSATLTGIIGFSLARTAHSRMMNVRSSHSKASCTLRITRRGSMFVISVDCVTYENAVVFVNRSPMHAQEQYFLCLSRKSIQVLWKQTEH